MHTEHFPAPHPEVFETDQQQNYFEGMRSLDEVLPAYQDLMSGVATEHQQRSPRSYDSADMGAYSDETSKKVDEIIGAAAATIEPMLDEHSSNVLAGLRQEIGWFGSVDPAYVTEKIQQAPPAVRVVLDADILQLAREMAANPGADPFVTAHPQGRNGILDGASSSASMDAMKAALGAEAYERTEPQTGWFGSDFRSARSEYVNVSSSAMPGTFDQQVRGEYSQPTYSAHPVEFIQIRGGVEPEDILRATISAGGYFSNMRREYSSAEGPKAPEAHAQPVAEEHTQPATEEAPEQEPSNDRISSIISEAVKNPQYRWLENESAAVTRVVDYVEGMRQGATKDGKSMTDKKIYIKLRHAAETDASRTSDVEVLEALMNGVDGKLSF